MPVPADLVALMCDSNVPLFVKTDNYVPAHIGLVPGHRTIGEAWDEARMIEYLTQEAALNDKGGWMKGNRCMIFIGDAKYHSWVRAYRISIDADGSYHWERIN
jgi:hypothetical protein